jgi:hypothetical protein
MASLGPYTLNPLSLKAGFEPTSLFVGETWLEKVRRKLQYAIPDHGTWGETMDNYEVFVRGGPAIKTTKFKLPRAMLVIHQFCIKY